MTCVLTGNGNVYCAGLPLSGSVNDSPTLVDLDQAVELYGSYNSFQATLDNGDTYEWTDSTTLASPVLLTSKPVLGITSGLSHTCIVYAADGYIQCVGSNTYLQISNLGLGSTSSTASYLNVTNSSGNIIKGIVDIVAATWTTCALLNTMEVFCWGRSTNGVLGRDTCADVENPASCGAAQYAATVNGVTDAVSIAGNSHNFCIVHVTSEVSCWGRNTYGELGTNDTVLRDVPSLSVLFNVHTISGVSLGKFFVCILTVDTDVWCAGINSLLELGVGATPSSSTQPLQITAFDADGGAEFISSGYSHSCAKLSTGKLFCWGETTNGALGDSSESNPREFIIPS